MKLTFKLSLISVFLPLAVMAEPLSLTIDKSVPSLPQSVGQNTTIITRQDLEQQGLRQLDDVLQQFGITISRNGGPASSSFARMRGLGAGHVLLLLDGVPITDPTNVQAEYNFAGMSVAHLERIEIMRGGNSTLYGANAAGGVINLITRKAQEDQKTQISLEGGQQGYLQGQLAHSQALAANTYVRFQLQGSRAAGYDGSITQGEDDRWRNGRASAYLQHVLSNQWQMRGFVDWSDLHSHYDSQDFFTARLLNADNTAHDRRFTAYWQLAGHHHNPAWQSQHTLSYSSHDRRFYEPYFQGHYFGHRLRWQQQWSYQSDNHKKTVFGFESQREGSRSDDNFSLPQRSYNAYHGVFVQQDWRFHPDIVWRLGGRLAWDRFDGLTPSFETGFDWHIDQDMSLQARAGITTRRPSLFQLANQQSLGRNLQAERIRSHEIHLQRYFLHKKLTVKIGYFLNILSDKIIYDIGSLTRRAGYRNHGDVTTQGVESSVDWQIDDALRWRVGYDYIDARDHQSDQQLLRQPYHRAFSHWRWQPIEEWFVTASVNFVGRQRDFTGLSNPQTHNPSYQYWQLTTNYHLTDQIQLYARLDNVFDQNYSSVYGYPAAPLQSIIGIKITR